MKIYVKKEDHFDNVRYTIAQPIMKKFVADIETVDGILNPITVELEAPVIVNDDAFLRRAARILQKRWRKKNGFSISRRMIRRVLFMISINSAYDAATYCM